MAQTPTSDHLRVAFSMVIDAPTRQELSGPWGPVTTPVELEAHVSCDQTDGPPKGWRSWVGSVMLKGGKVRVPASLTREARTPAGPAFPDPVSAALAAFRDLLAAAWPGSGS
jgi:hypothetical protein